MADQSHQWKALRLQGSLQGEYRAVCAQAWWLSIGAAGLVLAY